MTQEKTRELNGRAIAFPDAETFAELFPECGPYTSPAPIVATWKSWEAGTWTDRAGRKTCNLTGYLVVDADDEHGGRRSFHVKPSPVVIEWIGSNTLHVAYDSKTFNVVVWDDGRALVTCQAGQIIANYYLAIIDAASIPVAMEPPPRKTNIPKDEQKDKMAAERARYLDGEITHDGYYLWLSDWIGLPERLIPFTSEEVKASTDPHYNDLPLRQWDQMDKAVRSYAGGLYWSLSDTVCCLKALAKRRRLRSEAV